MLQVFSPAVNMYFIRGSTEDGIAEIFGIFPLC